MSALAKVTICTILAAFALALTASRGEAAPAPKKTEKKMRYLERVPVWTAPKLKKSKSGSKAKAAKAVTPAKPQQANLSREIVFDGSNVNGRYHSAGEAVARVESEKELNNLIGVRKDFKDRLAMERARLKAADQGQ